MKTPTLTPKLVISALTWIITQAVAFGILNTGTAQTIVSIGGIVIGAAFAIASGLHLGQVHAAQVTSAAAVKIHTLDKAPTPPPVARSSRK